MGYLSLVVQVEMRVVRTRENLTEIFLSALAERLANGSSTRELAQKIGVDHSTVVRWVAGQTTPGPDKVEKGLHGLQIQLNPTVTVTGRMIRARRIASGMTQREFAQLLGMNQSRLSKYESSHRALSAIEYERMARELQFEPSDPLSFSGKTPWSNIPTSDVGGCYDSYDALVRNSLFGHHVPVQTWMMALRHRLKELEEKEEEAKQLLSWLYGSHSYFCAANGKTGDLAQCLVGRLNYSAKVGFDLTSGYQLWAFTRTVWESGNWRKYENFVGVVNQKYVDSIQAAGLPYSNYVRALQCHLHDDLVGVRHELEQARTLCPKFDKGQFGCLGGNYMLDCASSYQPMFHISRRRYRESLSSLEAWVPDTSLFRVIHASYLAAALSGLSAAEASTAWERVGEVAKLESRESDISLILKHLRRIGSGNIPKLHQLNLG